MPLNSAMHQAEKLLSAAKLDGYEVAGMLEKSLEIEVKDQAAELLKNKISRGIAVRAILGSKVGVAATTDISAEAVKRAVKQAISSMSCLATTKEVLIVDKSDFIPNLDEKLQRKLEEIPIEGKISIAKKIEELTKAAHKNIERVQHPRYEEHSFEVSILNSKGVDLTAKRGLAECEVKAIASADGVSEASCECEWSPRFEDLDPSKIASKAANHAVNKLGGKPVPSGTYKVVIAPRAAATLLRIAAQSFFADNIARGASVLAGKLHHDMYSSKISIYDDGLLNGGVNSFPFDGEGTPRQRTVMVKDGRIESWLYDAARAQLDGVKSTGNCVRSSIKSALEIGMSNCFIAPSTTSQSEICKDLRDGLLISELMGAHTANAISGDISLAADGFLIENGIITRPVRAITVAANIHSLFSRVQAVADDLTFFGSTGSPSLLVDAISVGGA